jgi:hypothetical protein
VLLLEAPVAEAELSLGDIYFIISKVRIGPGGDGVRYA